MPTGPSPLSTDQIDRLRAELADGHRPMVWFTPAAVGVDAGRSAKVLAMGEPPEGDFIQVRPTGSQDELSFSPNELTMEKPARRKKPEPVAPVAVPPAPVSELLVVREKPVRKPAGKPAAPSVETPAPEPVRRGRTKQPAPVTVTLSSTSEGEWTVEVLTGSRRSVKPQPIGAGAVASAARALGGEIEAAIEGALQAAREQQQARVARLEAELASARQALDELS
jgi:hypothetical protein